MSVVNLENFDANVWIPPSMVANWRITITRADGTIDDITNYLTSLNITHACTDGIGSFEVVFPNINTGYTGLYTGMEVFTFYCDYAGSATTPRFLGYVEKPSQHDFMMTLTGRSSGLFFADQTVTKTYTNMDASDILIDLITTKGGGRYTTTGVVASTGVLLTVAWQGKPTMDCVKDLCVATGNEFYIDATNDAQFFLSGSRVNQDEAIVHASNLISVGEFAPDTSQVKNQVRVIGKDTNGIQVIYTANDLASQAAYGIKPVPSQDSNITDLTTAQQFADFSVADGSAPPIVGDVKSFMLATIQPGDAIVVSAPHDGLYGENRSIVKIEHSIDSSGIFTTCTINKQPRRTAEVLAKRVQRENMMQTISNPFDGDFSYPFLFTTSIGSVSGASIDSGVLHSVGGSGTWVSPSLTTASNVYSVSVALDAENKPAITIDVSGDGGIHYETITEGTLLLLSSSVGSNLVIKLTLADAGAQVKGVAAYYSLS